MSISIKGSDRDIRNLVNKISQSKNKNIKPPEPEIKYCSVDTPSLGNRATSVETLKKYLKDTGFRADLFKPVEVCFVRELEQEFITNGDHRRAMWKLQFPDKTTIPCFKFEFETLEELFDYMLRSNSKNVKSLTSEETFVMEVMAADEKAVQLSEKLKYCGLRVDMNTGEDYSYVGSKKDPCVKVSGFSRMMKKEHVGKDIVKDAVDFVLNIEEDVAPSVLPMELLEATAIVFSQLPELRDPNFLPRRDFVYRLRELYCHPPHLEKSGESTAKALKSLTSTVTAGVKTTNKHPESVAFRLLGEYRNLLPGQDDDFILENRAKKAGKRIKAVIDGKRSINCILSQASRQETFEQARQKRLKKENK